MARKYKNLDQVIERLPRYSYSISNKQMEPITLIIIGDKALIKMFFHEAGWLLAEPISLFTTLKSAWSTVFDSSYPTGPMWPSYINGKKNQMGFERPTRSDTYRRRHHLRLWKTSLKLESGRVWVGTASYDSGVGHFKNSLLPIHHISPSLIGEENFLARSSKIAKPEYVTMGPPETGFINTGDPYTWDGKAMVIDLGP